MTEPGNPSRIVQTLAAHPNWIALGMCAVAFVFGLAFLPLPGLQYDELLFLHPFLNDWSLFRARIERTDIPLMLMSYVGALKTWLYWPIYTYLPPSVWAVRLPMLLLGCVNIWLIYRLGQRLWGHRAGLVAAALAGTHSTFLLGQVFDWGPVTIQVFLSLSAGLSFLRWRETGRSSALALCGLCCGLALWNKAIFVWLLAAVAIAALICWPRNILSTETLRKGLRRAPAWGLAALTFAVGIAPIVAYNLYKDGPTFADNARWEQSLPTYKLIAIEGALDGHLISTQAGVANVSEGSCADGSFAGTDAATPLPGWLHWFPEKTWLSAALVLAVALLMLHAREPGSRTVFFMLISFVLWCALAMASIGGGTGVHHYTPILPAVFLLVGGAVGLALNATDVLREGFRRWWRVAVAAFALLVPLQAIVVLAGAQQRISVCGGHKLWTDASEQLATYARARPELYFHTVDWGIEPQAIYLSEKRGHIGFLGPLVEQPSREGPHFEQLAHVFNEPGTRLVSFNLGAEVNPHHRETLETVLSIHGKKRIEEARILNRRNLPVYVIWRLEPVEVAH